MHVGVVVGPLRLRSYPSACLPDTHDGYLEAGGYRCPTISPLLIALLFEMRLDRRLGTRPKKRKI